VRVCVEAPVCEELVEHDGREVDRDVGGVDASGSQLVEVVDLDRGDVLQRQHAPGGALPHDIGSANPGVAGEVLREPLGVRRFVRVVDLLAARYRELLDKGGSVDGIGDEPDAA
jgi:hypothetical protein